MQRHHSLAALSVFALFALAPLSRSGGPAGVKGTLSGPIATRVQMVYIENAPGNFPLTTGLIIDQKNIKYTPHISGIVVGSTVEFKTSDPQLHNIFVRQNGEMLTNTAMLPGFKNVPLTLNDPGVVRVTCVVHKEMVAWILVLQNPYFSLATDGAFTLPGVPAGKYTIKVWGEKLTDAEKAKSYPVEIKAGAPLAITL